MNTEENNQDVGADTQNADTGESTETLSLSRKEYDALMSDRATLGSLKREFKDLKKSIETPKEETPKKTDDTLLQKAFLRSAGVVGKEVDMALTTARKWGMSVDELVDDPDFQEKLVKFRTQVANENATSDIKGSGNTSSAKLTPEYYIARGTPPTREEVPDRKTRTTIAKAMIEAQKSNKIFYND